MGYLHVNNLYAEQTVLLFKRCWVMEKVHGCLRKGSKIALANGEELPIEQIKVGDKVLTFDVNFNKLTVSTVKNTFKKDVVETLPWVRLTFENGRTLDCTFDHKILTKNRGWVIAGELNETDEIIDITV
jgi:intein/homing endonuclease